MKYLISTTSVFTLLLLLGVTANAQNKSRTLKSSSFPNSTVHKPSFVKNEILVKYRNTVKSITMLNGALLQGHSINSIDFNSQIQTVQFSDVEKIEQVLASYNADPNVLYAEPNYIYTLTAANSPSDIEYKKQWALNNAAAPNNDIDAEKAWNIHTDCSANNTVIAVLDTGINYSHNDLKNNMWINPGEIPDDGIDNDNNGYIDDIYGWDFTADTNFVKDIQGHGTHTAGIIAAEANNSNLGTVGVCWKASLMALKFGDAAANNISTMNVVKAMQYAINNGATVMNLSAIATAKSTIMHDMITKARDAGIIISVTAGNNASDNDDPIWNVYPCNYHFASVAGVIDETDVLDNVICTAAVNRNYELANFSNFGQKNVDIAAPGGGATAANGQLVASDAIYSTWPKIVTTLFAQNGLIPTRTSFSGWQFDPVIDPWLESTQTFQVNNKAVLQDVFSDPSNYGLPYVPNQNTTVYQSMQFARADGYIISSVFQLDIPVTVTNVDSVSHVYGVGNTVPTNNISLNGGVGLFLLQEEMPASCSLQTCAFGINFSSDGNTEVGKGVDILEIRIEANHYNNRQYVYFNGTSMSAAHVTGLIALVKSYNPKYSYLDVINSVIQGGDSIAALKLKTRTGKAINAFGAINYVNQPVGVTGSFVMK